jgi:hypothetical protein
MVLQSNAGSEPQDVMSAEKPMQKVMATKRNVFFIDENIVKVEIMLLRNDKRSCNP